MRFFEVNSVICFTAAILVSATNFVFGIQEHQPASRFNAGSLKLIAQETLIEDFKQFLQLTVQDDKLSAADTRAIKPIIAGIDRELDRGEFLQKQTDDEIFKCYRIENNFNQISIERDSERFAAYLNAWRSDEAARNGFASLDDQQQIIANSFAEIQDSLSNPELLLRNYHLYLLGKHGPLCLLQQRSFQTAVGIENDAILAKLRTVSEKNKTPDSSEIVVGAMRDFLAILNDQQLDLLSRRLGIAPEFIEDIASQTDGQSFAQLFQGQADGGSMFPANSLEISKPFIKLVKTFYEELEPFNKYPNRDKQRVLVLAAELKSFLDDEPAIVILHPKIIHALDEIVNRIADNPDNGLKHNSTFRRLMKEIENCVSIQKQHWRWVGFGNTTLRFHAGELDEPTESPSELIQQKFAHYATKRRITALNQLHLESDVVVPSSELGMKIYRNQELELRRIDEDWKAQVNQATSLEEIVEINNSFLVKAGTVLVNYQITFPFQHFFCMFGPYEFFQRPDVQKEFQLSSEQIEKMNDFAMKMCNLMEKESNLVLVQSIEALFANFSTEEISSMQSHLGSSIPELASELVESKNGTIITMMLEKDRQFHWPKRIGLPRKIERFK